MSDVKLNVEQFYRRLGTLIKSWKAAKDGDGEKQALSSTGGILLVAGNADETNPYRKTGALQTYLLGYEFPSTLTLITTSSISFFCSESKTKILEPLTQPPDGMRWDGLEKDYKVRVLVKSKNQDEAQKAMKSVLKSTRAVLNNKEKIGCFLKDKYSGKFVDEWNAFLKSNDSEDITKEAIDVSPALSEIIATKEPEEMQYTEVACKMSQKLASVLCDQIANSIEANKKISHERLAELIETKMEDPAIWKGAKYSSDFDNSFADWCYTPIIQSGGEYDLKTSAQSNSEYLKDTGIILISLGIRYKSYCSNVSRTIMIDPHQASFACTQQETYKYLLELQKFALEELKAGVVVKDFYNTIVSKVNTDRPELGSCLPKSLGFGIGIEFRDSFLLLGPKCLRVLKPNMVFSLALSFAGIEDPFDSNKTYSLQVIDTVVVQKSSSSILADGLKDVAQIAFFMNEKPKSSSKSKKPGSRDEDRPSKKSQSPRKSGAAVLTTSRKGRLRNDGKEVDTETTAKRKIHQKELSERRQEEGLAKYAEDDGTGKGTEVKQWKRYESFQRERDFPSAVASLKIIVDTSKRSFILPMNGYAVPFHINTLKSVVKQEEGDYTVLRFMFIAPGQITGKKEDTPFEDPNATFIRGLTYRSIDQEHMNDVYRRVTDLKKAVLKREKDQAEKADVVDQDQLAEIRNRRPIKMLDISVRPSFDGKKQAGDVEIHQNGIRYQSTLKNDHRIDILFNNIKHIFFQPSDQELIVILHIHLKSPIFIGKKKTKDIQFFREASEAIFDETGNKKRRRQQNGGDEDEIEAEQEERRKRAELNRHFKSFAEKIAEASDGRLEVDIPFRELGFQGVPFRSSVLLQPTTECLVHLVEPPFLVVTLSEVEVAHLERIQYGLKNFDLVFVFRDFTKVPIHMRNVKEWIDSCDIPFSEGPVNLNWTAIMKTVTDDPYEFFKEGGWSFLGNHSDDEDEENISDDEDSAFEVSDIYEESSSDSGSESYDEDASNDSGSGSDSSDGDGSSVSEALDWSDQEREAAKADNQKKKQKVESNGKKTNSKAKKSRRDYSDDSDGSIDSEEEERKARKKGGSRR
ncbi:FACT complex subunit-domain-containing protein [Phakopsora pachyrhizi]|nr:FACT complex subunit-domain-containing protein [Phakopsora pachyrhizi]